MMLAIVNSLLGWDIPTQKEEPKTEDEDSLFSNQQMSQSQDEPNYLILVNILTDLRLSMLRCLLTRSTFKRLFSDYDQVYSECLSQALLARDMSMETFSLTLGVFAEVAPVKHGLN